MKKNELTYQAMIMTVVLIIGWMIADTYQRSKAFTEFCDDLERAGYTVIKKVKIASPSVIIPVYTLEGFVEILNTLKPRIIYIDNDSSDIFIFNEDMTIAYRFDWFVWRVS